MKALTSNLTSFIFLLIIISFTPISKNFFESNLYLYRGIFVDITGTHRKLQVGIEDKGEERARERNEA